MFLIFFPRCIFAWNCLPLWKKEDFCVYNCTTLHFFFLHWSVDHSPIFQLFHVSCFISFIVPDCSSIVPNQCDRKKNKKKKTEKIRNLLGWVIVELRVLTSQTEPLTWNFHFYYNIQVAYLRFLFGNSKIVFQLKYPSY